MALVRWYGRALVHGTVSRLLSVVARLGTDYFAPPCSIRAAHDEGVERDGGVLRWDGQGWSQVPGGGVRIAVDPQGAPWIVNAHGAVYRWTGGAFERVAGTVRDVGMGADGSVWAIGKNGRLARPIMGVRRRRWRCA